MSPLSYNSFHPLIPGNSRSSSNVCISGNVYVHGAAIGDAAVFLVHTATGLTKQLNTVARRGNSARDTGGQVTMCIGVDGTVSSFTARAQSQDIIILATDGLTDNLDEVTGHQVITLVIRMPFFDVLPGTQSDAIIGTKSRFPAAAEIQKIPGAVIEDILTVTPVQVVRRLGNYVKWVTLPKYHNEQSYFKATITLNELTSNRAPSQGELADIEQLKMDLAAAERTKNEAGFAGKTDDCMIVAFRPCCTAMYVGYVEYVWMLFIGNFRLQGVSTGHSSFAYHPSQLPL